MMILGIIAGAVMLVLLIALAIYAYSRTRLTMQFKVYVSERKNGK